jgi:hypothetical protein
MAKVGEMIESKYLKQSDVADDTPVTIVKVGRANVAREGDEPEYKWLIKFEEFKKPMVLNGTNIKRLARTCNSDDTDDWIGKKAILYVDPDVEFAGNVVGGLRVRAPKGAKDPNTEAQIAAKKNKFADMEDDIPF